MCSSMVQFTEIEHMFLIIERLFGSLNEQVFGLAPTLQSEAGPIRKET